MGKPDALSRQADRGSGQGDNDNLMLLAPKLFRIHALGGTRLGGEERNILHEVRCSLRDGAQEEAVAKVARELQKDKGRGMVKSTEWSESDGLLMFHGKIYVPNDRDLRCRICKGTSVRFLTSPIFSHSPPVHIYSLSSPLYHFQGPYL
jgi:hypothetical protein